MELFNNSSFFMDYFIICFTALMASLLTFFSGFGLGTILLPAFALFFPVEIAIAMTAIVHFFNNAFKFTLVYKNINKKTVVSFGIPALVFSFIGAFLLKKLGENTTLLTYSLFEKSFETTIMKIIVAVILVLFALFEWIPKLKNLTFDKRYLPLGGILSGFFGGLSGHQGALRSAFISKIGLSKEAFIASGIAIACLVDISRLSVYYQQIASVTLNYPLIISATLTAFIGAYIGNKVFKKITLDSLQKIVAIALIIFAIFLGLGLI
jgi:uncharacterized protein